MVDCAFCANGPGEVPGSEFPGDRPQQQLASERFYYLFIKTVSKYLLSLLKRNRASDSYGGCKTQRKPATSAQSFIKPLSRN